MYRYSDNSTVPHFNSQEEADDWFDGQPYDYDKPDDEDSDGQAHVDPDRVPTVDLPVTPMRDVVYPPGTRKKV